MKYFLSSVFFLFVLNDLALGQEWREQVASQLDLAFNQYLLKDFESCIEHCHEAMISVDLEEGRDDPQRAEATFILGVAQWEQNPIFNSVVATSNLKRAGASFERLFPIEDENRPDWEAFNLLSRSLKRLGSVPAERMAEWPMPLKQWLRMRVGNAGTIFKDLDFEMAKWCYEFAEEMSLLIDPTDASERLTWMSNLSQLYASYGHVGEEKIARDQCHAFFLANVEKFDQQATVVEYLNHGVSISRLGDVEAGFNCYQEANSLLVEQEVLGPESLKLLTLCKRRIAEYYSDINEFDKALEACAQATSLEVNNFGKDTASYARIQSTAGYINLMAGNIEEAKTQIDNSLTLRKKIFGKEKFPNGHPELLTSLMRKSEIHIIQGDFDAALDCLQQALSISRDSARLGSEVFPSRDVARCLFEIAKIKIEIGSYSEAKEGLLESQSILNELVRRDSLSLSDQRAFSYADSMPSPNSYLAGLLIKHPELLDHTCYESIAGRKSIASNIVVLRNAAIHGRGHQDRDIRRMVRDYQLHSRKLAKEIGSSGKESQLISMAEQMSQCWSNLCRSLELEESILEGRFSADRLSEGLPRNSVFLDMCVSEDGKGRRYCVFAIFPSTKTIRLVELGEVSEVSNLMFDWLEEIHSGNAKESENATALRDLIWNPIQTILNEHATESEMIIVSPIGEFNLFPWAALPFGNDSCLLEKYAFCRASSAGKLALTLGHPRTDFSTIDHSVVIANPQYAASNGSKSASQLPLSEIEMSQLESLFGNENLIRLSGKEATASAILDISGDSNLMLHLAAHRKRLPVSASTSYVAKEMQSNNPFWNVGVMLTPDGVHPRGFVAADTISRLDLRGLLFAFLAICGSGEGELYEYEQAASIQTAFHLAGADSTVATLWPVDSSVTSRVTGLFYDMTIRGGCSPIESLRLAQLNAMKSGPSVDCDEPLFWASWTIETDPRGYKRRSISEPSHAIRDTESMFNRNVAIATESSSEPNHVFYMAAILAALVLFSASYVIVNFRR